MSISGATSQLGSYSVSVNEWYSVNSAAIESCTLGTRTRPAWSMETSTSPRLVWPISQALQPAAPTGRLAGCNLLQRGPSVIRQMLTMHTHLMPSCGGCWPDPWAPNWGPRSGWPHSGLIVHGEGMRCPLPNHHLIAHLVVVCLSWDTFNWPHFFPQSPSTAACD